MAEHPEGRPEQARRFSPRTTPVIPLVHHAVTSYLDDRSYADVRAGGALGAGPTRVAADAVKAPARA